MNDSASMGWYGRTKDVVMRTFDGFSDDELMTRAAAIAFYTSFSLAPMLVLLLWLVSSLSPEWQQSLIDDMHELVGAQASEALSLVIQNVDERPGVGSIAGWISLVVALVGASTVFAQLQDTLNRIWGVRPRPGRAIATFLSARMHAIGLLLTLAFLLIVSLAASTLIAVFVSGDTLAWRALEAVISLLLFSLVFASMYKVLPDAIIEWRDTVVGALLTAALFALGKFGIGIYLDFADVGGAYGPAGSLVVLLVWVFYSTVIMLLGAEITKAIADMRGNPIRPSRHAEPLQPVPEAGRIAEPVDTGDLPVYPGGEDGATHRR